MTKQDFFRQMAIELRSLPEPERREILSDYHDHFDEALKAGKPEWEIIERLGSPEALAAEYLEGRNAEPAPTSPPPQAQTYPPYGAPQRAAAYPPVRKHGNAAAILLAVFGGIVFICLTIGILSSVYSLPLGMLSAGIGLSVGTFFVGGTSLLPGIICLQLAFYGFAFSSLVLALFVTKWVVKALRQYFDWAKKVIGG